MMLMLLQAAAGFCRDQGGRPASPRLGIEPIDPATPCVGKAAATSGGNVTLAWHGWTRLCLLMESTENGSERDSHGIRQKAKTW